MDATARLSKLPGPCRYLAARRRKVCWAALKERTRSYGHGETQTLPNQIPDLSVVFKGSAEVAAHESLGPNQILHVDGLVQSIPAFQGFKFGICGKGALDLALGLKHINVAAGWQVDYEKPQE